MKLVGNPHSTAVNGVQGPGVFGFRKLDTCVKMAREIDRYIDRESDLFEIEQMIYPFSHLVVGKTVKINSKEIIDPTRELENLHVGRIEEEQLLQYITALQGSVVVLDGHKDHYTVSEILSPARSIEFSAEYLEHLFNMTK
jgi:hypothetical protein